MEEIIVAFLDVGQGDSTVLTLPENHSAVVVDSPSQTVTINYLINKGIESVYVFLTHSDIDHVGGILSVVENFEQVNLIAYNIDRAKIATSKGRLRKLFQRLIQLSRQRDIDTCSPIKGSQWDFGGVILDVLHPTDKDIKECFMDDNGNNSSLLLRATIQNKRILLAADIGGKGWKWILERETDLQADVLKFPHHGAWYKPLKDEPSLKEILEKIKPSLVLISVGTQNTYDHPHEDTFSALMTHRNSRFLCTQATDKCFSKMVNSSKKPLSCAGTVEVTISNGQLKVVPEIEEHHKIIQKFDTPRCK